MKIFNLNWKIFWLTFIAMFIIVLLQHSGMQVPRLLMPIPPYSQAEEDVIKTKLEQKPNTFKPKKQTSLFPQIYASAISNTHAYGVVDLDSGDIIAEKNFSKKLSIASITKIMTAVVALDLADTDEEFTVNSSHEKIIPTRAGFLAGEKLTLKELLHALLLTSANDAAGIIKDGIDVKYQKSVFMDAMNKKAQFLGLKNSHFSNPQGFDAYDHYSSAEDVIILAAYALKNYPVIAEIAKKDYAFLSPNNNHKQFDLYNWNGLIGVYPETIGLKTGNTENAGYTTVVVSKRNGKSIMVVALGTPGVLERDLIASQLLDLGYETTSKLSPIAVTENQLREKYSTWKYWN